MGNYEVVCRLSTGGMAEIFLATKRGLAGFHKPVVLKKILPDIQGQEEFVQMFLDEAKVTAAFNHPHIAQVFDLDVDRDELFLAMEFVPGATLVEVARACHANNEPIPVGFGLASVRDTALALHYAHTFTDALGEPSPVIHRDVAEKNIMVTYEGVTKLLDFGIAKNLAMASRTAVGMVKGTSGYMSPEQIRGEPLDARSDLFSLGVVLHECLTSMRLFPGKSPMAVAQAVLRAPIPEPSRANKSIPPELDAIVLKALARKREERYASTLEFARELERTVGPLIWLPETSGELLRRLFAERREQTRQLLARGRAAVDSTGEVKLAQLFSDKEAPATPPPGPGLAATRTPPAGLAPPPAVRRPSLSMPVVPPPPPEDTNVRPALSTARPPPIHDEPVTQLTQPTASPRFALPEPPLARRGLSRAEAVPAQHTPEGDIQTAIMRPRPGSGAQDTPSPGASQSVRQGPGRRPTLDMPVARPRELPPEDNTGPELLTVPMMSSPRVLPPEDNTGPELLTVPMISQPAFARTRQVEPEEDTGPEVELPTAPALAPPASAWSPGVEPEDEDAEEATRLVNRPPALRAPAVHAREPARPRRGPGAAVVALVLLLLVGLGAAAVVLRLDGGLISSLLFPAPPAAPPAPAVAPPPAKAESPTPAPPPPPASTGDTAPAPQATVVDTGSTADTGASTSVASATEPSPSAASPAEGASEVKAEAVPAVPEDVAPPPARIDPPTKPTKRSKAGSSTRRKRGSAPVEVEAEAETSPEMVTNPGEADRAWEALERERSGTAETSGDTGTLTLVTDAGAMVYLGERLLGEAPLFRVSLPVGKHALRVLGTEGRSMKLQVEIKAGEVTSIRRSLEKPASK
jgi:serine/threonine protein kinase